jgi:hypothetical protein
MTGHDAHLLQGSAAVDCSAASSSRAAPTGHERASRAPPSDAGINYYSDPANSYRDRVISQLVAEHNSALPCRAASVPAAANE